MDQHHETFAEEIESLQQMRDELKLQLHLARAEAKDQFHALERKWHEVEEAAERARRASSEPAKKVADSGRALLRDIRAGYREISAALL